VNKVQLLRSADRLEARFWPAVSVITLVFVLTQLLFLWRPSVNLEYVFVEAAQSLAGQESIERLDYYWHYQANPLGYSLIASLLLRLLPMFEPIAAVRLVSVMGGVLLLCSAAELLRYLPSVSRRFCIWTLLLLAFHPMIWLYTNNATADVLPAGLVLASLACCLRGRANWLWHLPGVLLFGVSCIVKFNCALMSPGLVFILLVTAKHEPDRRWKHWLALTCYALFSMGCLAIYFVWINRQFGIVILPEKYKSVHSFDTPWQQRVMAMMLYLDFLVLFGGPLILFGVKSALATHRRQQAYQLAGLLIVFVLAWLGFSGMSRMGEMDSGGLLALLGSNLFSIGLSVGVILLLLMVYCVNKSIKSAERGYVLMMLATALPYLLISSMSRPAQRYLILILPLFLIWLSWMVCEDKRILSRLLLWSCLGMFLVLTSVGVLYLQGQGTAAQRMGRWIDQHQLTNQTDPGILAAHIGSHFPIQNKAKQPYYIMMTPISQDMDSNVSDSVEHRESVSVGPLVIWQYQLLKRADNQD